MPVQSWWMDCFLFWFMGGLASHWMQGQNLLWCVRDLSKVDEVAFVKEKVIWLRVCNWRKGALLSTDLQRISVWLKQTHPFAVLFSPKFFSLKDFWSWWKQLHCLGLPEGIGFALGTKRADSIWSTLVRGTFTIHVGFQWLLQSSFYLYLDINFEFWHIKTCISMMASTLHVHLMWSLVELLFITYIVSVPTGFVRFLSVFFQYINVGFVIEGNWELNWCWSCKMQWQGQDICFTYLLACLLLESLNSSKARMWAILDISKRWDHPHTDEKRRQEHGDLLKVMEEIWKVGI